MQISCLKLIMPVTPPPPPSEVGTSFNPHFIDKKTNTRSNFVTINNRWQRWDRGQSPLAPDLSFSLPLLYFWIKLVTLFVKATSPQSLLIDGSLSLFTVTLGIIQLSALRPLSVWKKGCISKEAMMNLVISVYLCL